MNALAKQARRAGVLYLLACLPAPFALLYVPSVIVVPGDAAATAERVRASGTLLRLGIAGEIIGPTLLVFAALAFYRLLREVDPKHALAMLTLILLSVPISFLNVLNELASMTLVSGAAFLSAFEQSHKDALAYLFLRLHGQGLHLAQIFWGLWLFPFGLLVMRSGFLPRLLGPLLVLAGGAYVVGSLTSLLLPQYAVVVGRFTIALEAGEAPFLIWLLVWGAKPRTGATPAG